MKIRSFLTVVFMIGYSLFMMLFGSYAPGRVDGLTSIFLWFLASFIAASLVWGIWNLDLSVRERQATAKKELSTEKKKREHIDSVLRDLSDEDLLRLRRRLLDGTINDESLEDALMGEDGEVLYGGRR